MSTVPQFDILNWLDPDARIAFLGASRSRSYRAGQIIYLEGDPGSELFRVKRGAVRLSLTRPDGRQLILLHLDVGDCFGDSSLVDGGPRPQTAQASSDVMLQSLDKGAFERLRCAHSSFNDAIMQLLAAQMRAAAFQYANRTFDNLEIRVISRLLMLSPIETPEDSVGVSVVRFSQAELAQMVGASRQHVNRVIQHLVALGLVSVSYGAVHIRDRAGLVATLDGDRHQGDRLDIRQAGES
jgi:CRP-like cAMP-binding protein